MQNNQQIDTLKFLGGFNQKENNSTTVNNTINLRRNTGILTKVYMRWQTNIKILNQLKEIYTDRLRTLRTAFNLNNNNTIQDLGNDQKICELVGLFKRIQNKRIRAFEPGYEENYKYNKPLISQLDTYELEDETSKIKLQFKKNAKLNGEGKFVSLQTPYGVIIKCNGEYKGKLNRFQVSNVETPKPAPQRKMILPKNEAKFMLVMCEPTISDLVKVLNFFKTSPNPQNLQICELVIIGGLDYTSVHQASQYDDLMSQLGVLINTYIIPSSCEETSHIFPLAPLPKVLLKKSYQYKNCANCSNPQLLQSNDKDICLDTFISCGENLLNLKANCAIKNDLQLMKLIIEYRHSCPSSAFSLPIFSYNYDPLVIHSTPHLMIHGKCDAFQTDFYVRNFDNQSVNVRLVGLAKGDFVRIDLATADLEAVQFNLQAIQTKSMKPKTE